jgi:hypothetical protein
MPWRRGLVVSVFAFETEDPGFESSARVLAMLRNFYITMVLFVACYFEFEENK